MISKVPTKLLKGISVFLHSIMTKDLIRHDKLFDLLAHVGTLTREVSTLAHGLEEKSRNKESSDEKNHATLDLLENIELLKEDLKNVRTEGVLIFPFLHWILAEYESKHENSVFVLRVK